MSNDQFISADLEYCRRRGHRFICTWSDKHPDRFNLLCVTCTEANPGKAAYCAYGKGQEHLSQGQWAERKRSSFIEKENHGEDDV